MQGSGRAVYQQGLGVGGRRQHFAVCSLQHAICMKNFDGQHVHGYVITAAFGYMHVKYKECIDVRP